ncbi:MAG TPA: multicopper oxidase domain-containing protein [Propionibacteriaceae bacterium]|nr:multicopper oxidase domain-containing protein [Propionibacteriaceae bacterium]
MTIPVRTGPEEAPPRPRKRQGGALRDRPPVVWLALALVFALLHPWFPRLGWAAIHLVLLGALTHSIIVWSSHFAQALLKTPLTDADQRRQNERILLHIAGTALVVTGVPTGVWPLTVAGATLVGVAVIWHGLSLWHRLRHALPGRFRIAIRYYLAASACLPVGATFGAMLAKGPDDVTAGRLLLAHSLTMVLGWVGLTVWGTLLTLWPTMLRTRLDDRADRLATQALPLFLVALAGLDVAALLGSRWGTLAAVVAYAAALCWWGRALVRPARTAPPRHASTWSVSSALGWFAVTLVLVAVHVATTSTWARMDSGYTTIAVAITVGFAGQILQGALSYLVPVVLGGGAHVWRTAQGVFDRLAVFRITVTNLGLVLWLVPSTRPVHLAGAAISLVALGTFLPVMMIAIHAAVREKLARRQPGSAPASDRPMAEEHGIWSPGQFVAGIAVAALALSLALAWDPGAAGLGGSADGALPATAATPTGRTTTLSVTAAGMRFTPDRLVVPAGNRLVIHVTNTDPTTTHDLVLETGADSGRLLPGHGATVDAGVVTHDIAGWCSIAGHRQMGMTLTIVASGVSAPASATTTNAPSPGAPVTADATVPADFRAADAGLPPIGSGATHRVTFTIEDRLLEVAPGVWQKRWTYNGSVPGPTLHGRVGDTFVVTLVNRSTMGHSIDFHAGTLAPDAAMRTIPPGASLTYTFTAHRAGIWMYHCSTIPMSAHIAAGMHGAVIIDPPALDPVSASFVLQQDAVYVAGDGRGTPQEVDSQAASSGATPTFYTFNGIAFQYDHRPLVVPVGRRIRLWLLNAGPVGVMDFHVVGAQFDTVYLEGAYQLKNGRDAFGDSSGGSQVLALQPGQGGFVELTLPEAGHYPFVSHLMADAERGAHGVIVAQR